MDLRPHQVTAVEMLRASLRSGKKRPMLAAPCSFGKTRVAAYILKQAVQKGKRVVFICDRVKLVEQALVDFDKHGLDFGVMQADHHLTDYSKPVQICSVQTLSRKQRMVEFDLAIVDEAHTHYEYMTKMMKAYGNVPFIGLSATPFTKGLGKHYDDLIVPATPRELLADGYLCPADYYGGRKVSLEGIKTRSIPTGGSDYDEKSLSEAMESDDKLVGDIVKNWLAHAEGRQTVAFAPSILHSKNLADQFTAAGIRAEHIDGYMDHDERKDIMDAHEAGEFKILSCSRLLNTGWDSPKTSCLIDCFPTKSKIVFVQRIGRVLRTAEGKENAIILDHSGNTSRHGFAEDIVPQELDDGEHNYDEKKLVKEQEEKEPTVRDCPQCYRQFIGIRCSCGYELPIKAQIESDDQMLEKLAKTDNKTYTNEQKAQFMSELKCHARNRGFSIHWASHKYKEKFGVWPNKYKDVKTADSVSTEVAGFVTSRQIAWAKQKEKQGQYA